jgi:lysophospholipase L1-like esterase
LLRSGQTIIFIGDHSTPDELGYVAVVRDVLSRLRPDVKLNLISAGGRGQTAARLASRPLLDILTSSRPDWLSISIGLADAYSEPQLAALVRDYRTGDEAEDAGDDLDSVIGPSYPLENAGRRSEGAEQSIEWSNTGAFHEHIKTALRSLKEAGVGCILHTTIAVGSDPGHPLNQALRAYSRVLRRLGEEEDVPVVDHEQAFRNVLDRASSYKQRVSLANERGEVNPQGQALLARTFLATFRLLPQPHLPFKE